MALLWEKQHKNVLRDIESMKVSEEPEIREFNRLNFEPITYIDGRNRCKPMYRMTAKGPHGRANFGESSDGNTKG